MKIEVSYQVLYYYDDVDLTEEKFNSMSDEELGDFADNLKECRNADRGDMGMVSCSYYADDDKLLKEI